MNLFFGKISKEIDKKQIEEGYYQAPKGSVWFGNIQLGDYTYLIGGNKIQFWKAREWRVVDGNDRLYFDIINPNLGITVNDLTALNFLKLSKAVLVLTSRSARKAFFDLKLVDNIGVEQLGSPSFYQSNDLFRSIKLVNEQDIDNKSKDVQLFVKNGSIKLVKADFFESEVYESFRDNIKYYGQGSRNKDTVLSLIKNKMNSGGVFSRSQIGLRAFYDAFFCDYKESTKYFLVGAFWEGNDPEDLTDLFVSERRWENGYDDKFTEETNSIPKGSFIAIKSAYVREKTTSIMKIKARGKVLNNHGDGHKLDVEWEQNFQSFEVEIGGYRSTVKEVTNKNHIEAIWENESPFEADTNMEDNIIDLLKYKKQIILQGPPGTGKTRQAKELARQLIEMTDYNTLDGLINDEIEKILKVGTEVRTVAGNNTYEVLSASDNKIELRRENGSSDYTTFNKIREFYNGRRWDSEISGNDERRAAALAKYIYDNRDVIEPDWSKNDQFRFIQFHPSYSYEDFVRGIVAESKGDKIEYKSINKILGKFAADANKNLDDSKKEIDKITKENKIEEYFSSFADDLNDRITGGETIELTPKVNLIDVEEDAFRYKGSDGWSPLGNRMLFKDIVQAFLDDNKVRQDIKKNKNLSGLAIQHATYFVRVLNMFQHYLETNDLRFDHLRAAKPQLKNYVLIIDEINRANLSSVLGELIYALEYRGETVESMYEVDGSNKLILPENLYIIGTMNTADRSVGHIDYAIRRRFAFVEVMPKDLSGELGNNFHKSLFENVAALFDTNLSPEFERKDVQLGHSYFIDKSNEGGSMANRLKYEIKPILLEYVKDGILVGDRIKSTIENLQA